MPVKQQGENVVMSDRPDRSSESCQFYGGSTGRDILSHEGRSGWRRLETIFWNGRERRPRCFWRLLACAALLILAELAGWAALRGLDRALARGANRALGESGWLFQVGRLLSVGLAVGLATRLLDRRPLAALGLGGGRAWWAELALGLALGALLMTAIFLAGWLAGWITIAGFWSCGEGVSCWAAFGERLMVFISVGLYEELLMRGYVQRNLSEGLALGAPRRGAWRGLGAAAGLFSLAHIANPHAGVGSTLNLILAGLMLGLGYALTGRLALPIGLHITWNLFQGTVYGLPVSGMHDTTRLIASLQSGPALWTGGDFGPEAGLLGTLAMLVGCGIIWGWARRRGAPAQLRFESSNTGASKLSTGT